MILMRNSQLSDLEAYVAFAEEAALGITSLPQNPEFHERRLQAAQNPTKSGIHLFSLELNGKIVGVSGFYRRDRKAPPIRVYKKSKLLLTEQSVHVNRTMDVLEMSEVPKPVTELGTLFLNKQSRGQGLGPLLSLGRFLFMANFPRDMDKRLIAALRGISEPDGTCPFWDAVGIHFYGHDFRQADYLRSEKAEAMSVLFPKTPIYVSILPYVAQHAIGVTHPNTEPAKMMLCAQGFKLSRYIDLFDAGPYLEGNAREIRAINDSKVAKVTAIEASIESPSTVILCNTKRNFRATMTAILGEDSEITIPQHAADILQVKVGDRVRYLPKRDF